MKLLINGSALLDLNSNPIEFQKITKGKDYILATSDDGDTCFKGITDFSVFTLEDENSFKNDEETTLKLALVELDIQREKDKLESQLALTELAEMITGGM